METAMIDSLEDFYRRSGILASDFRCAHADACRAGCDNFTAAKSSFVSSGYESGELPRLLFLSLDAGDAYKDESKRTPLGVRELEEDRQLSTLRKGKHWYLTHELAWYILREFKEDLQIETAKGYFAHANSAKCSMGKSQNAMADYRLYENCREYLKPELDILRPDIVVTQGDRAKTSFLSTATVVERLGEFAAVVNLSGRRVFWLHTYHPRYFGGFYRQRKKKGDDALGWIEYAGMIRKFITEIGATPA